MTTWKDGGDYGLLCREVTNEAGNAVCKVWTKQYASPRSVEPWPEGEANFRLILQAPRMLEALEEIVALRPPGWCGLGDVLKVYHQHKEIARAAIAAVKGEGDGLDS